MYLVAYRLSLLGWNVMPTTRNARGVDIVAYNADASRYIGIQVKTLTRPNPVPLGKTLNNVMGDFWVIVSDVASEPRIFVLLPNEIRELASLWGADDKAAYWLEPKAYYIDEFRDRWDRIS